MKIYISRITARIKKIIWIILPVFLGLFWNIILMPDDWTSLQTHFLIIGMALPGIISAIASINLFVNRKKWISYIYNTITILYLDIVLYFEIMGMAIFLSNKYLFIIWIIIQLYNIYIVFLAIKKISYLINTLIRSLFKKMNIQIITKDIENTQTAIETESNLSLDVKHIETDFSTTLKSINEFVDNFKVGSKNIQLKFNELISDIYQLKTVYINAAKQKNKLQLDIKRMERIKNLSDNDVDALVKRFNKNKFFEYCIAFVLGFLSSLLVYYITNSEYFKK